MTLYISGSDDDKPSPPESHLPATDLTTLPQISHQLGTLWVNSALPMIYIFACNRTNDHSVCPGQD